MSQSSYKLLPCVLWADLVACINPLVTCVTADGSCPVPLAQQRHRAYGPEA